MPAAKAFEAGGRLLLLLYVSCGFAGFRLIMKRGRGWRRRTQGFPAMGRIALCRFFYSGTKRGVIESNGLNGENGGVRVMGEIGGGWVLVKRVLTFRCCCSGF